MTQEQINERIAEVQGYCDKYLPLLGLNLWQTRVVLMAENMKRRGDETTYASCTAVPKYLDILVRVYPHFWDDQPEQEARERTILHELTHAITEAFWIASTRRGKSKNDTNVRDANETLTEHFAAVVWNITHPKGMNRALVRAELQTAAPSTSNE